VSAEEVIAQLRRDAAGARARHAQAVAGVQQDQARADAVAADLLEEFGVRTAEEARDLLASLDNQVAEAAAEARRQLDLAEGSQ
jgi:hypothetical protein